MATYYTLLTNIGQAKIANAIALGQQVDWVEMAVGDGNGNPTTPTEGQTALVNEVYRAGINQLTVDDVNPNYIVAEMVIPTNVGGWSVNEVGIFDDDGNMVAVANFPATYKPELEEGSGRDLVVRIIIQVTNASVVTLKTDPAIVLASQKWVIDNYVKKTDHATETARGVIEIATTTEAQAMTDDQRAITPKKLGDVTATETRRGIIEIATAAEAVALTDDQRALTPKKLDEALMGGNGRALTPAQFDNSTKIATTEFVKRQGMQSRSFIVIDSATTLTEAHAGASIFMSGNTSYTVTLPLAETMPPGARIEFFFSSTAGTQTIQRQGSDIIYLGGAGTHTSVAGSIGDSITFVTNGANWYGVSGSLQMGKASAFGNFMNANGYQKLPSGLIIQWGTTAQFGSLTSGIVTSTLPITFPNAALQAVVSDSSNATSKMALGVDSLGVSSISISYFRLLGSATSHTGRWFAVGW